MPACNHLIHLVVWPAALSFKYGSCHRPWLWRRSFDPVLDGVFGAKQTRSLHVWRRCTPAHIIHIKHKYLRGRAINELLCDKMRAS